MSLGQRRPKILDGEILFKHYFIDMGNARSYNKLARWASDKWGKSPETGRDWTLMAVWQAAWRWAFDNLDEARRIYDDVISQNGQFMTDDEWYQRVAKFASSCMSRGQYRRFMEAHPELKPYEIL